MVAILALAAGCFAPNPARRPQDLGGQHVSFTTSDGVLLRGHLYGSGSTGVILAHMYPADQSDWTDFANVLAAHGYQALTFDFRGFTESEGTSGTEFAGDDLMAAYQFLRPRVSHIFIAGASLGSEAAILVAAREPVAGIICISTPTSFGGLDVTESIRHVRAPILFVTSAGDPLVGGQPEILYKSAQAPKSIEVYPGSAHGTAILFGPHGAELQALMLRFIAANQPAPRAVSARLRYAKMKPRGHLSWKSGNLARRDSKCLRWGLDAWVCRGSTASVTTRNRSRRSNVQSSSASTSSTPPTFTAPAITKSWSAKA